MVAQPFHTEHEIESFLDVLEGLVAFNILVFAKGSRWSVITHQQI